jgi:hypothetical protein
VMVLEKIVVLPVLKLRRKKRRQSLSRLLIDRDKGNQGKDPDDSEDKADHQKKVRVPSWVVCVE